MIKRVFVVIAAAVALLAMPGTAMANPVEDVCATEILGGLRPTL